MSQTQNKYEEFLKVAKLINKTELSKNHDTLKKYRELIIPAYNKFVKFIDANYERVRQADKHKLDDYLERARIQFIKCLDNLKIIYELPNDLRELISEEKIGPVFFNNSEGTSSTEIATQSAQTELNEKESDEVLIDFNDANENRSDELNETNQNLNNDENNTDDDSDELNEIASNLNVGGNNSNENNENNPNDNLNTNNLRSIEDNLQIKMNSLDLFNAVNRQFKNNYSGDPLALTSFIDAVDILSDFATTNELKANLFKYIKAKLEGRAREFITDDM